MRYLGLLVVLSLFSSLSALEIYKNDKSSMNFWGRGQMLGYHENLKDPADKDSRLYLFLSQARLGTMGHVEDYNYAVEWGLGGEDTVGRNTTFSLLDFRFDVPVTEGGFLRVGQFSTPYGRESLSDDGGLLFTKRSLNNLMFGMGRDVGFAYVHKAQNFSGAFGIFTGGGRDVPERYLPQNLGLPLFTLRAGYDTTAADATGDHQNRVFDVKQMENAFYVNFLMLADSKIGHSSVMNYRPVEKPLILDANWNPYIAGDKSAKSRLYEVGFDFLHRCRLGEYGFALEGEFDMASFKNKYGSLSSWGARVESALGKKPYEVALRLGMLTPDKKFSNGTLQITDKKPIYEVTAAFNYYLKDWSRVILSASGFFSAPVAHEAGLGSYSLLSQPDQASFSATKTYKRETVTALQAAWAMNF